MRSTARSRNIAAKRQRIEDTTQKTLASDDLLLEEVITTHCTDCLSTKDYVAFSVGRVCPKCKKSDTKIHRSIRRSVSVLLDIGFKFNNIALMCYLQHDDWVVSDEFAEWFLAFNFDTAYPEVLFKDLPREYFSLKYKDGETLVSAITRSFICPISETPFFINKDTDIRDKLCSKVLKEVDTQLWHWVTHINELGHSAVWKLAGYFE